jgi:predicted nuclease of predicted toxin-antitoxin system
VRFLVDADLSPRVAEWLREKGQTPYTSSMPSSTKQAIVRFSRKRRAGGRILLTSDLDFGENLSRSSGRVSALILRLRSTATATVVGRLEVALRQAAAALEDGAVVIVGEATLRLRRLPVGS